MSIQTNDWNSILRSLGTGQQIEEALNSIGQLNIAVNIFRDAKNAQEAINLLNDVTAYSRILRSTTGEYVFILESTIDSLTGVPEGIYRVHENTSLINQNIRFTGSILGEALTKVNFDLDPYQIFKNLYNVSELIENNNCAEQFKKYFNYYDYVWYDPIDLNAVLKRTYCVRIIKDDKEYLICSGFTLDKNPDFILRDNINQTRTRIYIFSITLAVWLLFFWFFFSIGKNNNWKLWISVILFGIIISGLTAYWYTTAGNYSRELEEDFALKDRLIAIAGIALGLSILFSNTFRSYEEFTDKQIILLIVVGFLFTLLALILPVFARTGPGVRQINTVQRSLLAIAIGLVIYAMGTVFFAIP